MLNVEDIYTSTPPTGLDDQTRQLIETWENENPDYQNPQHAKGKCSHATGAFLRYAKNHNIALNALQLDFLDQTLKGSIIEHRRLSTHIVVDLGGGNIYDPTARQYHQNAPTPAYATYETMETMWDMAGPKRIKGIPKTANIEGWQPTRTPRPLTNTELLDYIQL